MDTTLDGDNLPEIHLFEPSTNTNHVLVTSHGYASNGFNFGFRELKQPILDAGVAIATFDYRYQQRRDTQEKATITSATQDIQSVVQALIAQPNGFTKVGIYANSVSGLATLTAVEIPQVDYIIFDTAVLYGKLQVDIVERHLQADVNGNKIIGRDILSKQLVDEVRDFNSRDMLKSLPHALLLYKEGDLFVPPQHGIFAKDVNSQFDLHIAPGGRHFENDPAAFTETKERILEYVVMQHAYQSK